MAEIHAECRERPEADLCATCTEKAASGRLVRHPDKGWIEIALTEPQQVMLRRSVTSRPFAGLVDFADAGVGVGLRRAAWTRMAKRLEEQDVLEPYVHGGFEVTKFGREVMRKNGLGDI